VLTVIVIIMTITGRSMCSVNSYCDNNGELYMQYCTITPLERDQHEVIWSRV
jgi:hypothetical protein